MTPLRRLCLVTSAVVCALFVSAAAQAPAPTAAPVVVKAARLFDSATGQLVQPGLVVVADGKVVSVGGAAPAGATLVDLGDSTLLPGFIDAHTHVTYEFDPDYDGQALRGLQ